MHSHFTYTLHCWSRLLLALLVVELLISVAPAQAQASNTLTVTSTADQVDIDPGDGICDANPGSATTCTLRAAIMEANVLGGRQTIRLAAGTFKLTIKGAKEDAARSGDLDITQDVNIVGDSAKRSTIDATGLGDRVFHITSSLVSNISLNNLVVRGGNAVNETGGGIRVENAPTLKITNSVIANNQGFNASGISMDRGTFIMLRSRVENNKSEDTAAITTGATVTIRASIISGNTSLGNVGGIILSGTNATVIIDSSTFSGNTGPRTGAIDITGSQSGRVDITNSTISGNTATSSFGSTGGIFVDGNSTASVNLANVTIARNSGTAGGILSGGFINASNTIIANNSSTDCFFSSGRGIFGTANIGGDSSCTFFGTPNRKNVNPLLGPLALNGATNGVRTHALLVGSPALDRGDNPKCLVSDQRGIRRPQGTTCDIGAFEQAINVQLGTATLTPAHINTSTAQTSTLTLSWTVPPTMTWHDLRTVDLQLDAGEAQPVVVRFSQGITATGEMTDTAALGISQELTPTDTLTLFNSAGEVGTGEIGAPSVLESNVAALDLAQSRLTTDGPDGQTVSLTLALRLKQPLEGKTFTAILFASDDTGTLQGPEPVGTVAVGPFTTALPIVVR